MTSKSAATPRRSSVIVRSSLPVLTAHPSLLRAPTRRSVRRRRRPELGACARLAGHYASVAYSLSCMSLWRLLGGLLPLLGVVSPMRQLHAERAVQLVRIRLTPWAEGGSPAGRVVPVRRGGAHLNS